MAETKYLNSQVTKIVAEHIAEAIRKELTNAVIELVRTGVDALVAEYTKNLVVKLHSDACGFDTDIRHHITIDFEGAKHGQTVQAQH